MPEDRDDESMHPKPQGDGGPDTFVPPDRPDVMSPDPDDRPQEVDVFAEDSRGERDDEPDEDDRPLRAEDDEGEEEEAGSYSRRVQRRINREISLRKRVETRLEEERVARRRLERRLARIERAQDDTQSQATLKTITDQLAAKATELEAAIESGDTKKQLELQLAIGDLQAEKKLLERDIAAARRAQESAGEDDDDPDADSRGSRDAQEWIRANRRWWGKAKWANAQKDAVAHDKDIIAEIKEGELPFEKYSDEHFEELARRLKADYPELDIRNTDGEAFEAESDDDGDSTVSARDRDYDDRSRRSSTNGKRRAPMGGMGGRDGRRERSTVELARQGKVRLEQRDFDNMRRFGLNPNNPRDKKYYANERRRTILTDATRGARR